MISQQDWDIAQYEAALAHLEKLQEQIHALRNAMPAIVTPLISRGTSKQQAFASLSTAAVSSATGVEALKDDWTSEAAQKLFAKSDESLKKDPDLSKAAYVQQAGWGSGD
ncbi:hypothetical protein DOTSEDRAFT_74041 [Dothistroma septosporum NZE10]|uniref:Uncharacterized protein n=1 Tax=Dothistroma septosporum (strain NZE10 / CBS 128990) TaxID=675120 RepID=N1PJW4_DOTSN|nr:hypothetical protein DOTSEDRAFT_74041 [Dothistroma septosporum NZE10]